MMPETLDVSIDFTQVELDDYAAVIMAANYTSVRLRWNEAAATSANPADATRRVPAVYFFRAAMQNRRIVKGALCHGLWLLTARPDLLRGRRVISHEVVLADVVNAGALFHRDESGVVVDRDLVTGHDWHTVGRFVERIAETIVVINPA